VGVPALVAERPGARLTLPFEGSQLAVVVTAGPDAGVLEWRVDGGPWASRDLFTRWSRGLHLPWTLVLESALAPGPHRVELRVGAPRNAASSGHAVRIFRVAQGTGTRD
jgi:sialidase-1